MKTISLIFLFSMIFYCCTSTHMVMHEQSAYNELNEELRGEKGQIILLNDDVISGENIILGTDSTSWISSEISEASVNGINTQQVEQYIATSEIKNIVYENNTKGAWEGFGFGAIGGLIASVIVAASMEYTESGWGGGPGQGAIPGILIGGTLAGGIIGAPIGAFIGHKEKYQSVKSIAIGADELKLISEDFVAIEWDGRIINLPQIKIMKIEQTPDKMIITIPLELYKEEFD